MKVTKWVDMGQEVEIEIGVDDIVSAMGEAFDEATRDPLDEAPSPSTVKRGLNCIAQFLRGLSDEQIVALGTPSQKVCSEFLKSQAERFKGILEASK